ncbi:hypothetical protein CHS0354_004635 [Potamilus streckersoni]|uniref:EGF-like domain-containing protein n=1 Tax=Potamilus streckersoni TaxID=2493646 RepID=A0AAE0VQE0_9BIVA|nr:hypothetical protein CHS0354_004635 [Potamilus streckersoni]
MTASEIDEPSSSPCREGGICVDQVAQTLQSKSCSGYMGPFCITINIDECSSSPCQNGGSCVDKVNGFLCTCQLGFNGPVCETNIDECSSSPCQNGGSCVDQVNGYSCTCPDGFNGLVCSAARSMNVLAANRSKNTTQ